MNFRSKMLCLIAYIACGQYVELNGNDELPTNDSDEQQIPVVVNEMDIAPLRILEPNGATTTYFFEAKNGITKLTRVADKSDSANLPIGDNLNNSDQEDPNVKHLRETKLLEQHVLQNYNRIRTLEAIRHRKLHEESIRTIKRLRKMQSGII